MFFVGQMCVQVLNDLLDAIAVCDDERADPKYIEHKPLVKSEVAFLLSINCVPIKVIPSCVD